MASTTVTSRAGSHVRSIGTDRHERLLAWAAVALRATALAIVRGRTERARTSLMV